MNFHATRTMRRAVGVSTLVAAAVLMTVTPADAAPATATVTGTATGPSGEVLAGLPVNVGSISTVTTSTGTYTLTGITPGTKVRVYGTPPPQYRGGTAPSGYAHTYSPLLTLDAGSTTTVDLHLRQGAALAGRVLDDRTGLPLARAKVQLFYTDDANGSKTLAGPSISTAADGTWWVRGLNPSYPWSADAHDDRRPTDAPFGWRPTRYAYFLLALKAGSVTKGISFRLVPFATIAVTATAPTGSGGVDIVAGEGIGVGYAYGTGPSFTLHPDARYGTDGDTGPVCASGISTTASPLGLAEQCADVAFSATQQSQASFALAVGGAVTGAFTNGSEVGEIWVDWDGRRIEGRWDNASRSSYTLGNVPTGTYVVHATTYNNLSGQSAPVRIVQGKVTKHVDITLS